MWTGPKLWYTYARDRVKLFVVENSFVRLFVEDTIFHENRWGEKHRKIASS